MARPITPRHVISQDPGQTTSNEHHEPKHPRHETHEPGTSRESRGGDQGDLES